MLEEILETIAVYPEHEALTDALEYNKKRLVLYPDGNDSICCWYYSAIGLCSDGNDAVFKVSSILLLSTL